MIWNVNGLLDVKKDCWHFHQLLHQLRLAKRDSRRDVLENDLGHIDNLLGRQQTETWRRYWRTSGNCSTISGTGTSSIGTRTNASIICSTVCRCVRSCGPGGSARLAGRHPAVSSSYNSKNTASPATLVLDVLCVASLVPAVFCPCRAACCSCLHTHSSLNSGGNAAEEWWKVSARTVRTVCRSCFSHERSRRSRRLLAAPLSRSTSAMCQPQRFDKSSHKKSGNLASNGLLLFSSSSLLFYCCCCCFGHVLRRTMCMITPQ